MSDIQELYDWAIDERQRLTDVVSKTGCYSTESVRDWVNGILLPKLKAHLISKKYDEAFDSVRLLRPCDCKDEQDTKKLQEIGICHNADSLEVSPNFVTLKLGHTTITMSMHRFRQFAEWYLAPQKVKEAVSV